MVSTITSKGQLTVPKKIREVLRLQPGNKIEFIFDKHGNVKLIPVKNSIKELKGMAPRPEKPVSLKEMQDAIEYESNS